MATSLGIYIEDNIIKYAKVSKEHDLIKVEAFGVRVYDKLTEAIDKLVEETYSQKASISVNTSKETYHYFNVFSLLAKNDMEKAIKTEFDTYCEEQGYNPNVFETRYAIVEEENNDKNNDKVKIIYVANNKLEMNKRKQEFAGYKIASISPLPMTIPNLLGDEVGEKTNLLIVNIEEKTTVTTVKNKNIQNVELINEGSGDFLSKINIEENSYSKAYEICKNTTIYTSQSKEDLQVEESEHLQEIMPTIYSIATKVKNIVDNTTDKFDCIYLTGTGAMINNVDLYFQEYIQVDCKIIKPYFVQGTKEIPIKDYQEVNSAISLALMGLGEGVQVMNFKHKSAVDLLPDWLRFGGNSGKSADGKKGSPRGTLFINDLGQKLTKTEMSLLRVAIGVLALVIIYIIFSGVLTSQIGEKKKETISLQEETTKQIEAVKKDDDKIKSKTNDYTQVIESMQSMNKEAEDRNKTRDNIPDLLNQLMYIIPSRVQITSIENTEGSHVEIIAKSEKYEQLGYFKAKIKSDVLLTNVVSTSGEKEEESYNGRTYEFVTIKIEGDMP